MAAIEFDINEVNAASSAYKGNDSPVDADTDTNHKRCRETVRVDCEFKKRKHRRLELLLTVPSYTLTVGAVNLRHENRARLWYLLRKLVLQHNWGEASGVLSALLKATCHERTPRFLDHSLRNDRLKYSVAMELCRHMERDSKVYSTKIEDLFRTWILKIRSTKNAPFKDRYIMLDHILSSFARNEHSITHDALKSLKQASAYGRDPMSYLVIGLASYEVWYSGLLEEMRQRNMEDCVPMLSETLSDNSSGLLDDTRGEDADSINETGSGMHHHSEASVVDDNGLRRDFNQDSDVKTSGSNRKTSRNDVNFTENPPQQFLTQDFSENTVDTLDESDDMMENHNEQTYCSNAFNVHGLQSLLPFRVPLPVNLAHYSSYKDYYNDAVKYLKFALQSPPPISEASLLPLIQLLLLGDHVSEAFSVLQQFCNESNSALPYRLMARLQECVESQDFDKLSSCLEDVVKKDPTCRRSLTRLIGLHRRGDYAPDRLVEMISLHLEATYGDLTIWREFANCLLKISICDRVSMCMNGEQVKDDRERTKRFSKKPDMFVEGLSGRTWKLRCKWWLNRHFSKHVLRSEIEKGEWELIVYKAACASHLFGNDFEYVVKVRACTKKYEDTLSSFLRTHMNDSLGFFSNIVKKRTS